MTALIWSFVCVYSVCVLVQAKTYPNARLKNVLIEIGVKASLRNRRYIPGVFRSPIGTCLGRHDDNQLISARAPTRPHNRSFADAAHRHCPATSSTHPPQAQEEKHRMPEKSLRVPPFIAFLLP